MQTFCENRLRKNIILSIAVWRDSIAICILWCIRMFLSFFLSNAVTSYCGSSCFANIEWNEINLYANLITSFASGALRSRHTHKKKVFAKQQTRKFLDEFMMMIYQDKTWQSFCIPQRFRYKTSHDLSLVYVCACMKRVQRTFCIANDKLHRNQMKKKKNINKKLVETHTRTKGK